MSTLHICSACRRILLTSLRRQRHNARQWRSTSTFVSLTSSNTKNVAEDVFAIGDADNLQSVSSKPQHAGRAPASLKTSPRSNADLLEILFQEGCTAQSLSKELTSPTRQVLTLSLYERFETLKGLLASPNEPIDGIWKYFVSHLSAPAWRDDNNEKIPRPWAFEAATSTLLLRLKKERKQSQLAENLPTVSEITQTYVSLDLFHPADWRDLVYDLLRKLNEQTKITAKGYEGTASSPARLQDPNVSAAIREDILGAWEVFCRRYSNSSQKTLEKVNYPWSFLSCPETTYPRKGGLNRVFLSLWPFCPLEQAPRITPAALVTFALITDRLPKSACVHPFILAIARLLVGAQYSAKDVLKCQAASDIATGFNINWPLTLTRAEAVANWNPGLLSKAQHSVPNKVWRMRPLVFSSRGLSRMLHQAVTERNLKQVDDLWAKMTLYEQEMATKVGKSGHKDIKRQSVIGPVTEKIDGDALNILSQEQYDQFITAYMGLRQPNRAIDVWNYMIEISLYPSLSTWNAMLEGCKAARNATSLEGVWTKLLNSGLEPDAKCWRTRISGLIDFGKPELAVRILYEMGHNWRENSATKKQNIKKRNPVVKVTDVAKPTIEIINDTVSGLFRRKLNDAANRVLAWADGFGIKPDIVTYNILIRSLLRDGRTEAVPALLAQMQKQDIQADVATFTTILDSIFSRSNPNLSLPSPTGPKEQMELANLVFTEMEAAGVRPNLQTYNKIISSLLKTKTPDITAVQAILARMAAQNLEPSRDTYTILVMHHFSQDPPDIRSVGFLLERIQLEGIVLDHIFWDRVIEGYARIGDTASALAILGRVDKESMRVGWSAMEMVVLALMENEEDELARQVVRNVKIDRGGPPDVNEKGVEGQHNFWRTVAALQLMDV